MRGERDWGEGGGSVHILVVVLPEHDRGGLGVEEQLSHVLQRVNWS